MTRVAFYAGSFDPPTLGHVDIMRRSTRLCDELTIGVGQHHSKSALLSPGQRIELLKHIAADLSRECSLKINVVEFGGLIVDCALAHHADFMIRGIRSGTDLDYEMQMAGTNQALAPDLLTVFLPTSSRVSHISSTFVRQIYQMGGNIQNFVPEVVFAYLDQKQTI